MAKLETWDTIGEQVGFVQRESQEYEKGILISTADDFDADMQGKTSEGWQFAEFMRGFDKTNHSDVRGIFVRLKNYEPPNN